MKMMINGKKKTLKSVKNLRRKKCNEIRRKTVKTGEKLLEILFIVYSNTFFKKFFFLPHVRNFTLIYGPI